MPSSNALFEIDGPIATLTFNRPQARNALTWDITTRSSTHASAPTRTRCCPRARRARRRRGVRRRHRHRAVQGLRRRRRRRLRAPARRDYRRPSRSAARRLPRFMVPRLGAASPSSRWPATSESAAGARVRVPITRTLGNRPSVANCARAMDFSPSARRPSRNSSRPGASPRRRGGACGSGSRAGWSPTTPWRRRSGR